MTEEVRFFTDLGLLFLAALAGGTLAHFLRLPLIVGYLIGGVLVSPFTPGPTVSDPETFRLFAEVGVILLMSLSASSGRSATFSRQGRQP